MERRAATRKKMAEVPATPKDDEPALVFGGGVGAQGGAERSSQSRPGSASHGVFVVAADPTHDDGSVVMSPRASLNAGKATTTLLSPRANAQLSSLFKSSGGKKATSPLGSAGSSVVRAQGSSIVLSPRESGFDAAERVNAIMDEHSADSEAQQAAHAARRAADAEALRKKIDLRRKLQTRRRAQTPEVQEVDDEEIVIF